MDIDDFYFDSSLKRLRFTFLYLACFLSLCAVYIYFVSVAYEYAGFRQDVSTDRMLVGGAVIAAWSIAVPTSTSVRSFFVNFVGVVFLVPAAVLYSAGGFDGYAFFAMGIAAIIVNAVSAIKVPRVIIMPLSPEAVMMICLVLFAVMVAAVASNGGPLNFDFSKIYQFRTREGGAEAYFTSAFSKVVAPFAVALSLHFRYRLVTIAIVALSILLFGMTGHKSMLFAPIFAIMIYYAMSFFRRDTAIFFAFCSVMLLGLADAFLYFETSGAFGGWFTSLLIRRALLIPAYIDYGSVDLFANTFDPYFWSTSRLTLGLIQQPYEIGAPFLVGEQLFGSVSTSANVGFFGSGYAQAGLAGVTLYSAVLGMVISLLNSYSKKLGAPFVISATIMIMATAVLSTDTLTLFLTHGLALAFLLLGISSASIKERNAA